MSRSANPSRTELITCSPEHAPTSRSKSSAMISCRYDPGPADGDRNEGNQRGGRPLRRAANRHSDGACAREAGGCRRSAYNLVMSQPRFRQPSLASKSTVSSKARSASRWLSATRRHAWRISPSSAKRSSTPPREPRFRSIPWPTSMRIAARTSSAVRESSARLSCSAMSRGATC